MLKIINKFDYENFTFRTFVIQYFLRSEFIGFGILTPFFAILGYLIIEIPMNLAFKFFLTAFITAFIVFVYVIISNYYYLRFFRKYLKFIYEENHVSIQLEEKKLFLEKFFKLPLVRSLDVFIRTSLGIILFSIIINFYLNYSFYQIIVSLSIFFIFSSSAGLIYYILLEDLIHNIINSNPFKQKFRIENLENLKFLKFRYTLSYLFFLSFFMISSISSLIASKFNEYWIKKFQREKIQESMYQINFLLNQYFQELTSEIRNLEIQMDMELNQTQNIPNLYPMLKEFISKNETILDYAFYHKSLNKFLYYQNNYIIKEKNRLDEWFLNPQEFFISNGFRHSSKDVQSIIAFIKPYKFDYYHIIFLNFTKLEQELLKNIEQSPNLITIIIDKNNIIISSSDKNLMFQPLNNLVPFINIKKDKQKTEWVEKIYYNKELYELMILHESISNFKLGILFSKSLYQNPIAFSIFVLATIFMFIGLVFIFFIVYIISIKTKSLITVSNLISETARGNLKQNEMYIYSDEFGSLSINLINLIRNLRETIKKTKDLIQIATKSSNHFKNLTDQLVYDSENEATATEQITATTEEISATMDKIAEFSNEQSSLVNSLSHGIRELTNVIKEAQENIKEINAILRISDELKQKSEQEIQYITQAMNQIQQTSSKITNIVNIVKEIADQINLLSLNASIEAARAGEYGKGFAVVADEVSKLADKTMFSIKEINTLIKNSNEQIQNGINISRRVNEFLNNIIKEIQKMNQISIKISEVIAKQEFVNTNVLSQTQKVYDKSHEINSMIKEQKTAIKEITESISSINKNILNTTENSKKINTSALALEESIKELETLIQFFHWEE